MNFVWVERGEPLAANQPWAYTKDWFGTLAFWALPSTIRQREWSLWLDMASSETKAIKTIVAICKFQLNNSNLSQKICHELNTFSLATKSDSKFETPLLATSTPSPSLTPSTANRSRMNST
jgi:hypothetical protein